MSAAVGIRARMGKTARRIRRLHRIERALEQLQRKRQHELDALHPPARPTIMYDDVNLDLIPADAPAVAGYVGGRWPTYPQLAKRFPKARRLSIAVNASQDADCLDVEPGDAVNAQAPAWVKRQIERGLRLPVIYTSASNLMPLLHTLASAGIPRQAVRVWSAHFTGHPHLCGPECGFGITTRADATQYTDRALGRSLDESLCSAGFWR